MTNGASATRSMADVTVPGIAAFHELPHEPFLRLWDAIVVDGDQKDRLLSQAILNFTLRPQVDPVLLPLHGLILLIGPPGTGKTSLARGLASRVAQSVMHQPRFNYLEVEPHALASAGLGRSQQAVRKLLGEVIPERAALGPLVVLLDEVETLAADRTKLSLQANPVDVHRATDALLAGLDQLAADHQALLFIATSNFEDAIDPALLSRADLVEVVPRPRGDGARAILRSSVGELARLYPAAGRILEDPEFARAADACQGLDGRQIRKLVVSACTFDKSVALDPGRLEARDLLRAAERAQSADDAQQGGGTT